MELDKILNEDNDLDRAKTCVAHLRPVLQMLIRSGYRYDHSCLAIGLCHFVYPAPQFSSPYSPRMFLAFLCPAPTSLA
eukprot:751457-Hanusia_phi.AAC.1